MCAELWDERCKGEKSRSSASGVLVISSTLREYHCSLGTGILNEHLEVTMPWSRSADAQDFFIIVPLTLGFKLAQEHLQIVHSQKQFDSHTSKLCYRVVSSAYILISENLTCLDCPGCTKNLRAS